MILKSFSVRNFKCFRDSREIKLERGFNILVGQNNSGKTALLQALELRKFNQPHKSSAISASDHLNPTCEFDATFEVSGREIRSHLLAGQGTISLYQPLSVRFSSSSESLAFLERVLANDQISVSGRFYGPNPGWAPTTRTIVNEEIPDGSPPVCSFTATLDKRGFQLTGANQNAAENAIDLVSSIYSASCFRIRCPAV